ncbi:hypothetical protein P4T04_06415 [Bacillus badius]|uniref:hypothetical protein n=1 Tax=Bacillus badius TaxID=1455 RepID=UPI002E21AB0A|nr:hypothetical protein [Bacillus badius]
MKMIQTLADIEVLKVWSTLPLPYIKVIEQQFMERYEAEGNGESITAFRLPTESCLFHLEDDSDTQLLLDYLIKAELVEYKATGDLMYYQISLMNDHQMSLIYFLEGTLSPKIEQWLQR